MRFTMHVLLLITSLYCLIIPADAFTVKRSTKTAQIASPWGFLQSDEIAYSPNSSVTTIKPRHDGVSITSSFYNNKSTTKLHASATTTSDDDKKAVKIIIAGAPASGKGTQCEKIKETYGVVHLSTGDMLRAAVAAGTDVGKEAKAYMDSGKLVPDSTIIGVVKDRLQEEDCQKNGWLLDGFPRTPAQAKALEEAGIIADCFLFLNVPDEILVERVVGRRTDPVTGKIYHMKFSPPTDPEIIERLQQRSDDTEEKVKVRLEQFHANVDAVKDSYSDILFTIDGNQAPDQVSEEIVKAIGSMVEA